MKSKTIKKLAITSLLMLSQPFAYNTAHANAAHFIDHGSFTIDTISRLDWLDVTITAGMSYNTVSSQLGIGGSYEGWRYATGVEFDQMVTNYTGITINSDIVNRGNIIVPEGAIDNLHFLLGSTLDTHYLQWNGNTYDASRGGEEGQYNDYTKGIISDLFNPGHHYMAEISDDDNSLNNKDIVNAYISGSDDDASHLSYGSFLVRDSVAFVPVPAAVWFMVSGLLGLMGFSRKRKYCKPMAA